MEFTPWLGQNWISLVQSGALTLIAGTLVFDARTRRVANLIRLTEQHRSLWERVYSRPQLARVLDPAADIVKVPVTTEEELFVISLVLHLSSTYYASRTGLFWKPQGLENDIRRFFSLPIPRAVWERVKELQDGAFVEFVGACLPVDPMSDGGR
jgi:hypothetical protein